MITKRTKMMLGVLVLVAIGAYAYLYWWSQTPVHGFLDNIPAVSDASNKAADAVIRTRPDAQVPGAPGEEPATPSAGATRTYENTEFGFSFAYPEAWVVSSSKVSPQTTLCLNTEGALGGCLATVTFEAESVNMNAEIALDALRSELRAGTVKESSGRIGGVDATRLTVSGYPAGEEEATRAAVFVRDRMVFTIRAEKGQEAAYDRLVSSFRFVD